MRNPLVLLYGTFGVLAFLAGMRVSQRTARARWTTGMEGEAKERALLRIERGHRRLLVFGSILFAVVTLTLAFA